MTRVKDNGEFVIPLKIFNYRLLDEQREYTHKYII